MVSNDPVGASELAGHVLTRPLKHTSGEIHSVQVVGLVSLKPGLQMQALEALEPSGEVKFAGQGTRVSALPPGQ